MNTTARPLPAGPRLHARARAVRPALLALCATALACLWLAYGLRAEGEAYGPSPLLALGPLLAAGAIGLSLYEHGAELDATAARPARGLRALPLLGLLAAACALLLLAALAGPAEGRDLAALTRNTLGATGLATGTAALAGARASWLPAALYLPAVHLAHAGVPAGRAAQVWAWSAQAGDQPLPWGTALLLFLTGLALHALRGPRPLRR